MSLYTGSLEIGYSTDSNTFESVTIKIKTKSDILRIHPKKKYLVIYIYIDESRRHVLVLLVVFVLGFVVYRMMETGVVARNHIKRKIVSKHNQSTPINENTVYFYDSDCDGMDCSKYNKFPHNTWCLWQPEYCKKGTCMSGLSI